jgi:hypothetical protein
MSGGFDFLSFSIGMFAVPCAICLWYLYLEIFYAPCKHCKKGVYLFGSHITMRAGNEFMHWHLECVNVLEGDELKRVKDRVVADTIASQAAEQRLRDDEAKKKRIAAEAVFRNMISKCVDAEIIEQEAVKFVQQHSDRQSAAEKLCCNLFDVIRHQYSLSDKRRDLIRKAEAAAWGAVQ